MPPTAPLPARPQLARTFPLDLTMSLLAPGADSAAASLCLPWWPPWGRASHAWLGWLVPGPLAGCCGHLVCVCACAQPACLSAHGGVGGLVSRYTCPCGNAGALCVAVCGLCACVPTYTGCPVHTCTPCLLIWVHGHQCEQCEGVRVFDV